MFQYLFLGNKNGEKEKFFKMMLVVKIRGFVVFWLVFCNF